MQRHYARTIRDIAEVCAIVAAGLWAIYVFAFQNNIVPSLAPPAPTFTVTMHHVGNDGQFAVVRFEETIRNPGTVPVHFIAVALTILGTTVSQPSRKAPNETAREIYFYSAFSPPQEVYRSVLITTIGDPRAGSDLMLAPGQDVTISREIYVPRNRFDRLEAWLVAGYNKDSHPVPARLAFSRAKFAYFKWGTSDYVQFLNPMAELDLKAE